MFRASLPTVVALFSSLLLHQTAYSQPVPLPMARINATEYDAHAGLMAFIIGPNVSDGDDDDDEYAASIDYFEVSDYDPSYPATHGYAELISAGASLTDPGVTNPNPYYADINAQGHFFASAGVDVSDPSNWQRQTWPTFDAWATINVEIEANSSYPTAGTTANSATLHTQFTIAADALATGHVNIWMHNITMSCNSSDLTAYPISSDRTDWYVYGSLSQGTSSNPSASPQSVSDTFYNGILDSWFATEATNVGGEILAESIVQMYEYVCADTYNGPNQQDQVDWPAYSDVDMSVSTIVSFTVDVP